MVRALYPNLIRLRRHRESQKGFSLIELMVSVGVSSMVTLVTGGLILNAVKTMRSAGNNSEASSLVNNIRTELTDPLYASTPQKYTTGPNAGQLMTDSTGQPIMTGCTKSFQFDPNYSASTILGDLQNSQQSGTCAPVQINLTRTSANPNAPTFVNGENGTNTTQSAQGQVWVQSLQFCNAQLVETDANKSTYTGELYITQSTANQNVIGTIAKDVMGASYGARQYVARVVVGIAPSTSVGYTPGTIVSCDAAANADLNGQNCTQSGMYFNSQYQRCESYVVQNSGGNINTCNPLTQTMYNDGSVANQKCLNIQTGCFPGTAQNNYADGTVAGGYDEGKLICNRPRYIAPTVSGASSTPPLELTTTPPTQSTPPYTQAGTEVSTPASPAMPAVSGSNGATVNTSTISSNCQATLDAYLACLTAKNDLAIELGHTNYLPDCSYLQNAVCQNSTNYTTVTSTAGAGTGGTQQLNGAVTALLPNANDCMCGTTFISPGQFCGYCAMNVDQGYNTTQTVSRVEVCQLAELATGNVNGVSVDSAGQAIPGILVPQPGAAIVNANQKCTYTNIAQAGGRVELLSTGNGYKIP